MFTSKTDLFLGARLLLLALSVTLPAGVGLAQAQPVGVRVEGAVEKPASYSADELRSAFAGDLKVVNYSLKGTGHSAHGIPLWAIIRAASPRVRTAVKNHLMGMAVSVRARDGYTACFSLGELSPDAGGREVWVALDQDGKPLADREAPAELIIPGDAKPARWVRAIRSIVIIDTVPPDRGTGTAK